jgi:CRP-like cAMP-binding protein
VKVVSQADTDAVLSAALRREGHSRRFRTGQALFTEGDRAERVFLIERGWVIVTCAAPTGREIVLGLCGRGDVLGELSAFDDQPRSATAVAVADVEAIVAPGSALARALEDVHAAHELIRVLAARLRDADRKRLEFAALDTLGRVSWRLLELSDRFGRQTAEGTAVELPVSQEQLASWCGASREATVKALAALRAIGCITTGRRSLVIRDVDALRRHALGIA